MSKLGDVYYTLTMRECDKDPECIPEVLVEGLLKEMRANGTPLDEDAVVYTMACSIAWGCVAQLTHDADDPGWVNRAVGATEGYYPHDYCGTAARKRCGLATAVRTFTPAEFLARDQTGTLVDRAQAFEDAFAALIESKLAD